MYNDLMSVSDTDYEALKRAYAKLEKRVEQLEHDAQCADFEAELTTDTLVDYRTRLDAVEQKLFPKLRDTLIHLAGVIGMSGPGFSKLDYRRFPLPRKKS